jgi:P4 family phage/plasmid primase-like protien
MQELHSYLCAVFNFLYKEGDVIEFRALKVQGGGTVSGYFNNASDFANAALAINGHASIYATLNPVNPELMARASNKLERFARTSSTDVDVIKRNWLLLDFDPVRPSGICSTDDEHKNALDVALRCRTWMWEQHGIHSAYMDSGNGAHLLIPIDMPNDDASRDLIKRFLEAISDVFDDDLVKTDKSIFNASRITKFYGTVAVKGDNVPARPWRYSQWLDDCQVEGVVPTHLIEKIAALLPTAPNNRVSYARRQSEFDMESFLKDRGIEYHDGIKYHDGYKWQLDECPFNSEHKYPDAAVFVVNGVPGFRCLHNSCYGLGWSQFRDHVAAEDEQELDISGFVELRDPLPGPGRPIRVEEVANQELFNDGPVINNEELVHSPPVTPPQDEPPPVIVVNEQQTIHRDPRHIILTDRHNAEHLVLMSQNNLRWMPHSGKWLEWNGLRWETKETHQVYRYVNMTLDALAQEISVIADEAVRRTQLTRLLSFNSKASHSNMLELAKQYCSIRSDVLDRDIYLMNVNNGTLDLRTGELLAPSRDNFMTKLAPVTWRGLDENPEYWKSHLGYFLPEPGLVGFLQRWCGYCLTGETRERKMVIMYGAGSNGKSIICETQSAIMGDYSMNAPSEMLMARGTEGVSNDLARLQGARSVHMSETDQGRRLAEAKVKEWTGKDTVTARFLHQEFFSYRPEFKMTLRTNHRPTIIANDHGIWDRIMLLPFDVRVPEEFKLPHDRIEAAMRAEHPAILAWMVRGCIEWYNEGLKLPGEIIAASNRYRDDMDTIGQFVRDACVTGEARYCDAALLWAAYKVWCEENGEASKQQKIFLTNMQERGYLYEQLAGGVRKWIGLDVKIEYRTGAGLVR